ncbi:Alcohol dehydrogenase GroES-like protein [Kalmanozyma brasiliensis GHG001]|uniref:alcohol dehydrogenase n=1 Tax=Kalmanozyma brasiliensis (strain GHG001) TaxID=1365824 RepID=V5GPN7_KALBG|nr:Alcohol dehydrogenase GroES-like protein [Kalmanozyma brasiliensis GHG001]EST07927.1 Alcohol dehydrogenase GroES-like protein [Kalmanozyma brasiliensis GHG001]
MAPSATSSHSHADAREQDLQISGQNRVAIFDKQGGPVSVKDVPIQRDLKRGEALVRVIYSGVCHTDLHAMLGDWPLDNKLPLVGGHEGAGVVVALGEGADQFVKIGDRVGIKWIATSCLNCSFCRTGAEPNCPHAQCSGFSVDGSFQKYAVSYANHLSIIPDGLPLDQAAPILCAGVTVYKALKEAQLLPGQWVAIPGAGGGLGHLAVQYARAAGYRIIAIDTGDDKRQLCESLGAEKFIDFKTSKNLVEDIKAATPDGFGPQAAVVAASGAAAYEQALDYIRPRGVLVAVGLPGQADIKANVFFTVFRSVRIVGSYVGNRQDAQEALDIAASGRVKTTFKTLGLSQLPQVFDDMHSGKIAGRIVLDIDQ